MDRVIIAFTIIVLALLYFSKDFFTAARVNGQRIPKWSVSEELSTRSGKEVLNSKITEALLLQEAKKRNIVVSEEEIGNEFKKIEKNFQKQGQKLDQALELQGMTRDQFREQIRVQIIIEKMVGPSIKVTDKEIDEFIATNREAFPQESTPEEIRKNVENQLKQNKLGEKFQQLIEKLKKESKIENFLN